MPTTCHGATLGRAGQQSPTAGTVATMSLAFLVTALVIVATPGTGALYTIATGLARGTRARARGVRLHPGHVPHLLAAVTGLAAVLHASGVAFQAIKYLGVAYLLWMAWSTWRDPGALTVETGAARVAPPGDHVGVTINLLNPKLTIFFFAFLPQFVRPARPHPLARMLLLSGVFMAMTFVVFAGYGACAAPLRDGAGPAAGGGVAAAVVRRDVRRTRREARRRVR